MSKYRTKKNNVEDALIAGLHEAIEHERGKITLKTSSVELPKPAPSGANHKLSGYEKKY